MAFPSFPDLYSWLEALPPMPQWKPSSTISLNLSPQSSSSRPSLKLSVKSPSYSTLSLSIYVDYNLPIVLWTSKTLIINPIPNRLTDDSKTVASLVINFIEDILKYAPNKCPNSLYKLPFIKDSVKDIFNFCFLSLVFVICIYEAPNDVRCSSLHTLKDQFSSPKARSASTVLMRVLGSNTEEIWMRSVNLAITNWIFELQAANMLVKTPSPLFSHSLSTFGLWKVQLYCPVIAMTAERSSSPISDERLAFSLNYHQLEGVIQLNYKVKVCEKWIEVMVNVDNVRCDVVKLLTDKLLSERGAGASEKHFPSRIALQITPTQESSSSIIALSVSKSSDNPPTEITFEKGIEASFEPPTTVGVNFSAAESSTSTIKPWKFEQSVWGNSAKLNWFLHDVSGDGREVFSSRPSRMALLSHKAWFRHRYSHADRAFTREGGVVFAGDEYGDRVVWKVDKGVGRRMDWEVRGWIWATYWPNKYRSSYSDTRRLEFRELVSLTLV